jgi:hypothetical protein
MEKGLEDIDDVSEVVIFDEFVIRGAADHEKYDEVIWVRS